VFSTAKWRLRHTGSSGLARVFDYDLCRRKRVCLLCIFMPPLKVRSRFTKLLTRAIFIGACYCSYIFAPFAFMLEVTWIKNIVCSRRAHTFEPELPYAIKYLLKHTSYRTECFLKQSICIEHWIWSPIQWTVPISRIISNER